MTRAHNAHSIMSRMHAKYVDDITVAEALDLTNVLDVESEENLTRPLNHHQRTKHTIVPGCSQVGIQLQELKEYTYKKKCK